MFRFNALFLSDGYKVGHRLMLAENTTRLYGTWIPRSVKHAPKGINKIVSFGQQMTWKWIHDQFEENFFKLSKEEAVDNAAKDLSLYLGLEYNKEHFSDLYDLGYLPMKVKSLPEGIETGVNIPHMTFINTVRGFGWLTLYLETIVSSLAWKPSTSATLALQYKRNTVEWVEKTDKERSFLIPYLCHDFSARGLDPWTMISSGLGHASSFRGSDTLPVIPAARYFYNEPKDKVSIESVNASEHSVTCTGIFYYERKLKEGKLDKEIKKYYSFDIPCVGSIEEPDYLAIAEWLNLRDWLKKFPTGILSVVSDTMDLWKLITQVLPRLKEEILSRDGKLVIRPDSGDPVDITCGNKLAAYRNGIAGKNKTNWANEEKGVIELLWDIFGGTTNEQGYKVLDSHIGAIYGDSINLERQISIYSRLADKKFAATNIVLGVGSFTYQFNTRDTFGFAAKGSWFETGEEIYGGDYSNLEGFDIYKDPITDDGTKKSLKGRIAVFKDTNEEYYAVQQCSEEEENTGVLQVIYEDGKFVNQTTLEEIRERLNG